MGARVLLGAWKTIVSSLWEIIIKKLFCSLVLQYLDSCHEDSNSIILVLDRGIKLDNSGLGPTEFSLEEINPCLLGRDRNKRFRILLRILSRWGIIIW